MAIFVDLEEESSSDDPRDQHLHQSREHSQAVPHFPRPVCPGKEQPRAAEPLTPDATPEASLDKGQTLSAPSRPPATRACPIQDAFACYPIVEQITSQIDLNTLDSLARTNRSLRFSLLAHRNVLRKRTLRCVHDHDVETPTKQPDQRPISSSSSSSSPIAHRCARDLVAPCRRCNKVICRNCTVKPPRHQKLVERHRRLCDPCQNRPLSEVIRPNLPADFPLTQTFAQEEICACEHHLVWLCHDCGDGIHGQDFMYQQLWNWRKKYGQSLGGVGISEGDRGVRCGRGEHCLSAKTCEQEIDCDAEDARRDGSGALDWWADSAVHGYQYFATPPHDDNGTLRPGYARHQVEGIGGTVKNKLVQMVRVGGCVWDGPEGVMLARERSGDARSWCSWCRRIIPGPADRRIEGPPRDEREMN